MLRWKWCSLRIWTMADTRNQKNLSQEYQRMYSRNYRCKGDVLNTRKSTEIAVRTFIFCLFYVSLMKRINLKYKKYIQHVSVFFSFFQVRNRFRKTNVFGSTWKSCSVGQHSKSSAKIGYIHVGNTDMLLVPVFIIHCIIIKI